MKTQQERVTYRIRTVRRVYTRTIEEKTDGIRLLSLTIAEGIHKLFEGRGALYFEEHLVVVIGDLDV